MFRGLGRSVIRVGVFAVLLSGTARAETIAVGFVSFDLLIPGDPPLPGVNAFNINNFTGSNFLAPDFPVVDDLSFLNGSLTLAGDFSGPLALGTIAPGSPSFPSLEFPDTTAFTSAVFAATLSQTTFMLSDGRTMIASLPTITASLLPSSGVTLVPGSDFVVLTVEATESAAPEPSYQLFGFIVLISMLVVARRRVFVSAR